MSKPLYDKILAHIAAKPARFYMPGHFGAGDTTLYASAPFDITELEFSDNLQNPTGAIAQSEGESARIYGAKKCYYLTSGSTTGISIALATLKPNTRVIMERASHKSVYAAVRRHKLLPEYIMPRLEGGIPMPPTAEQVEEAFSRAEDAAAVILTSPNYFGLSSNERELANVVSAHGALLIADIAHGAHFPFSERLSEGYFKYADIAVTSFHKTLPVYGGGAAIFVNNDGLFDKIASLRADLHTTSPSYITLASIDYAIDRLSSGGREAYERLYERVGRLKDDLKNIRFLQGGDFTRLVALLGEENAKGLASKGIWPEMVFGDYAVFILSPENCGSLDLLERTLGEISPCPQGKQMPIILPVRGGTRGVETFVNLDEAVGKTSAREVGVYPPGIPLAAAGEVITSQIAEILRHGDTFGFVNNKLCVTIDNNSEN